MVHLVGRRSAMSIDDSRQVNKMLYGSVKPRYVPIGWFTAVVLISFILPVAAPPANLWGCNAASDDFWRLRYSLRTAWGFYEDWVRPNLLNFDAFVLIFFILTLLASQENSQSRNATTEDCRRLRSSQRLYWQFCEAQVRSSWLTFHAVVLTSFISTLAAS
jgi:hypothetical protein